MITPGPEGVWPLSDEIYPMKNKNQNWTVKDWEIGVRKEFLTFNLDLSKKKYSAYYDVQTNVKTW
mgnify:CR=1 FL=1